MTGVEETASEFSFGAVLPGGVVAASKLFGVL